MRDGRALVGESRVGLVDLQVELSSQTTDFSDREGNSGRTGINILSCKSDLPGLVVDSNDRPLSPEEESDPRTLKGWV